MAYPYGLNEPEVLVHHQCPRLLHVKVLHLGVHIFVYSQWTAHVGTRLWLACGPSLAQLACRYNGDGLGLPNAVVVHKLAQRPLAKGVEVIVAVLKDSLHQVYGTLLGRARPYEYGQQLRIGECRDSFRHEFLARTVFLRPICYAEFFHHFPTIEPMNYL